MYVAVPPDWVVWAFLWQLVGFVLFPIVLSLHAGSGKSEEFFLAWVVICFWPLLLLLGGLVYAKLHSEFGSEWLKTAAVVFLAGGVLFLLACLGRRWMRWGAGIILLAGFALLLGHEALARRVVKKLAVEQHIEHTDRAPGSVYVENELWDSNSRFYPPRLVARFLDGVHLETLAVRNKRDFRVAVYHADADSFAALRQCRAGQATARPGGDCDSEKTRAFREIVRAGEEVEQAPSVRYRVHLRELPGPEGWRGKVKLRCTNQVAVYDNASGRRIAEMRLHRPYALTVMRCDPRTDVDEYEKFQSFAEDVLFGYAEQ